MAHEISIVNGKAEMMYFGERPWHGLGTEVPGLATAAEAIEAAHLGWTVEKRRALYRKTDGSILESDHYITVRNDVERALGVVTDSYEPIQNVEAFSFLDALTATEEAKYETAGALFGGRKIWVLSRIPGNVVLAEGDEIEKYFLVVNTHDGSAAMRVYTTPIRVVCNNTLRLSIRQADREIRITHTGDPQEKLLQARKLLQIVVDVYGTMEQQFSQMIRTSFNSDQVMSYFNNVLEIDPDEKVSTRKKNVRSAMASIFDAPKHDTEKGTLFGAYQAVSDYADHYSSASRKDEDHRMSSLVLGAGADLKIRAHALALDALAA